MIAADAAFYAVFGVFVVAFAVLVVVTLRWAVRRDRAGRAEWLRRKQEGAPEEEGVPRGAATQRGPSARAARPARPARRPARGQTNGHVPRRNDQHGGTPRRPS